MAGVSSSEHKTVLVAICGKLHLYHPKCLTLIERKYTKCKYMHKKLDLQMHLIVLLSQTLCTITITIKNGIVHIHYVAKTMKKSQKRLARQDSMQVTFYFLFYLLAHSLHFNFEAKMN